LFIKGVKENAMQNYLETLKLKHRKLNRLIDNCKAAGRQQEMQQMKRLRLRIKDKMAALQRRSNNACS
tara:strand:+ start:10136 stop:10339 length:204 start_codon:yes stop_codon:yes gene_type:complete